MKDLIKTTMKPIKTIFLSAGIFVFYISIYQVFAQNILIKNLPLDSIQVVNAIVTDAENTVWLGTAKGLVSINRNSEVKVNKVAVDTLKSSPISCILIDSEQNKWIGTYTGQVFKISAWGVTSYYNFSKFGNHLITNILLDRNNNLWLSTAGNGIYTMSPLGDMLNFNSQNSPLPNDQVFALHLDNQGVAWIGTGKGLIKLSGINRWEREKKIEGEISALAEYNGDLWVGVIGLQETELWKYESYRKWVKIELPNFMRYTRFMKFAFDRNGKLWVATSQVANFDNGIWNLYGDEQGLTSKSVTCLHFDQNNHLWIGSDGKGAFTTAPIQLPERKEEKLPFVFIEEKPYIDEDGLVPDKVSEAMLNKPIVLKIQFQQSRSELLPNSIIELEKLVEILNKNPDWLIEISGHTDNVGNPKLNLELSEQRAEVVRDYIMQRGIAMSRITTLGFGGSKPIASNSNPKDREKNRRVEIVLRKRM